MSNPLLAIILSAFIAMGPIQAAQNVHTHGSGQWHIMSTEDRLIMTMTLPAMPIVGFEHKATTNKEKEIIDAAKKNLQDPSLFAFYSPSKITKKTSLMPPIPPSNASVNLVVESPRANSTPHDDDHHHNDHPNHKDHDEHNAHNETHAEFQVSFEYKKPDQISSISTTLFKRFNGIEKIEATIITDQNQSSTILTKDNPSIRL